MAEIERETMVVRPTGSFTAREYAERKGISRPNALTLLERMERMGKLRKTGAGNRVFWTPI